MARSYDVDQSEEDRQEDKEAESQVHEHDECDGGDAGEGQAQVADQLVSDDRVRLPRGVDLALGEGVRREVGRRYESLDHVPRIDRRGLVVSVAAQVGGLRGILLVRGPRGMTAAKKREGGQEITQPMFRVVTESPREILTTVAV